MSHWIAVTIGVALSAAVGVPIGWLCVNNPWWRRYVKHQEETASNDR